MRALQNEFESNFYSVDLHSDYLISFVCPRFNGRWCLASKKDIYKENIQGIHFPRPVPGLSAVFYWLLINVPNPWGSISVY